jgi:hypothetical protein
LSLPSESITIHIPSIPDGCGIGRFSIAKTTPEIEQVAPPEQAALFLQQRAGGEQKPCVKVGDQVLTGQVIAKTPGKYPPPIPTIPASRIL